jgi:hypothetical protein
VVSGVWCLVSGVWVLPLRFRIYVVCSLLLPFMSAGIVAATVAATVAVLLLLLPVRPVAH